MNSSDKQSFRDERQQLIKNIANNITVMHNQTNDIFATLESISSYIKNLPEGSEEAKRAAESLGEIIRLSDGVQNKLRQVQKDFLKSKNSL